ncbi:MAG: energy transducer TonB [Treponema sp.]|jgi:protein TonB|nr:energy transducer TonB [Treponema sp.]
MKSHNRLRLLLFAAVALLHGVLIFTIAFTAKSAPPPSREARVMKLAGIEEDEEEEKTPPPIREERPVSSDRTAETMIETEEALPPAPSARPEAGPPLPPPGEQYLPMHQVSVPPVFDNDLVTSLLPYPPIALRSRVEGRVILELFIDRTGLVRNIITMREEPPGYGFAEAAVRAFTGLRCVPAEANGESVSARFRYPVTFRIGR